MAGKKKNEEQAGGKISISEWREMMNKKAGQKVSFDLNEQNPTNVDTWISTGSHVLDCIICKGKKAGIPMSGKMTFLEGVSQSGKSFLAAKVAGNAQKLGIIPVYFDAENAIDSEFLMRAGVDVDNLIYIQAIDIETVCEQIETFIINSNGQKFLFILDSYAATPCRAENEGSFDPQSSIALKVRIMSLALRKLTQPLANSGCGLIITNHLKTNIARGNDAASRMEVMINPLVPSGGLTLPYYASLRLQLTGKNNKASFVKDEQEHIIGSETKVKIKKSRFGTLNREIMIKLLWGDDEVRFADEETWLEIIKDSEFVSTGSWWTLKYEDGTEKKFRSADFADELKDEKFKNRVVQIAEKILIEDFDNHSGSSVISSDD